MAAPVVRRRLLSPIALVLVGAVACGGTGTTPTATATAVVAVPATAPPTTAPGDLPRSAFPSGAEGTVSWANACFPDRTMGLQLIPDMPYTSMDRPQPWWDAVPHDGRPVLGGRATEYVAKDPSDGRVTTTFSIRAVRWWVHGRASDARYRAAVECVHRRLEQM